MNFAFLISLTVPFSFFVMLSLEPKVQARDYVPIRGWRKLGFAFFAIAMTLGALLPLSFDLLGLMHLRVFDLSEGGWATFPLGLAFASLANYFWHRCVHSVDPLWFSTHQLHHSARRVDVAGAFFTHPLEVVAKTLIATLSTGLFLGLSPEVASAVSSTLVVLSTFQHWNINTPRALGYIISRPEMHALHHEFDIHARNYSEFAIWDMIFGTYENPMHFEGRVGFVDSAASRLKDMLLMRNVNL